MKLNITTEPLSREETDIILGAYDTAKAAHDAVMGDNWENARAEFRDLCNAAMDEAVTYLVQRGLAHINEAGDGWHVILETDE